MIFKPLATESYYMHIEFTCRWVTYTVETSWKFQFGHKNRPLIFCITFVIFSSYMSVSLFCLGIVFGQRWSSHEHEERIRNHQSWNHHSHGQGQRGQRQDKWG